MLHPYDLITPQTPFSKYCNLGHYISTYEFGGTQTFSGSECVLSECVTFSPPPSLPFLPLSPPTLFSLSASFPSFTLSPSFPSLSHLCVCMHTHNTYKWVDVCMLSKYILWFFRLLHLKFHNGWHSAVEPALRCQESGFWSQCHCQVSKWNKPWCKCFNFWLQFPPLRNGTVGLDNSWNFFQLSSYLNCMRQTLLLSGFYFSLLFLSWYLSRG